MKPVSTVATLLTKLLLSLVLLEAGAIDCPSKCNCHHSIYGGDTADCSSRGLTDVEIDGEWPDIHYISFASNNISTINDDSFLGFPSVKKINLEDNQINSIGFGAFRRLEKLEEINLESNEITEMPYVDLPESVKTLFLSFNPLSFSQSSPLPLDSGDVEVLALNYVGLEKLELPVLSGLAHVNELQAGGNKINSLDLKNFAGLRNLKVLYLDENEIDTLIPPPDGVVLRITHLYLDSNKLKNLESSTLKFFENLSHLYLRHNPLVVPSHPSTPFISHPRLEFLDLAYTTVREITNETFDLPSLWGIRLEGSGVYSVDNAFKNMPNLEGVSLISNAIRDLPDGTFAGNGKLLELLLDENPLMDVNIDELQSAMSGGSESELGIENTPLACSCAFKTLSDWTAAVGVNFNPLCVLTKCTGGSSGAIGDAAMPDPKTSPLKAAIKGLDKPLTSPEHFFEDQEESN